MDFNIRNFFKRNTGDLEGQQERLLQATESEIEVMAGFTTSAMERGLPKSVKMPDDSKTALDAVLAQRSLSGVQLAYHAEAANFDNMEL